MARKIIQIVVSPGGPDYGDQLYALTDDGTVWRHEEETITEIRKRLDLHHTQPLPTDEWAKRKQAWVQIPNNFSE